MFLALHDQATGNILTLFFGSGAVIAVLEHERGSELKYADGESDYVQETPAVIRKRLGLTTGKVTINTETAAAITVKPKAKGKVKRTTKVEKTKRGKGRPPTLSKWSKRGRPCKRVPPTPKAKRVFWTKETVLALAQDFSRPSEFQAAHTGAYLHAMRNGYLSEVRAAYKGSQTDTAAEG